MPRFYAYHTLRCATVIEADDLEAAYEKYNWLVDSGQLTPEHNVMDEEVEIVSTGTGEQPELTELLT